MLKEYKKINSRHCELEALYPWGSDRELELLYPMGARTNKVIVPGRNNLRGAEVHHICGSGGGAQRVDLTENMICVCNPVHAWLETYKLPGFVLCCYRKMLKKELDLECLSDIKGKLLPGWLETDEMIAQCKQFPFIDQMRKHLLDHVPEVR